MLSSSLRSQDLEWAVGIKYNYSFFTSASELNDYMQVDAAGNTYVAGDFIGNTDFDPDTTKFMLNSGSCADLFIAKYNNIGSLKWAYKIDVTSISSFNQAEIYSIDLDASGNVYICGSYWGSLIFNSGSSIDTLGGASGHRETFIVKYSSTGNLMWKKRFSSIVYHCLSYNLVVGNSGDLYISGSFADAIYFDHPSKAPGTSLFSTAPSKYDHFVVKISSSGSYIWSQILHGTNILTQPIHLVLDQNENIFLFGIFRDTLYMDSTNQNMIVGKGNNDLFLAKYDSSGNYVNHQTMTGSGIEYDIDVGIDASGNIALIGRFQDTLYVDTTFIVNNYLARDYFVAHFSNDLDLDWVYTLNPNRNDKELYGLGFDNQSRLYLLGSFRDKSDFDYSTDTFYLNAPTFQRHGFVSIYDDEFNILNAFSIEGMVYPNCMKSDGSNNIYIEGTFRDTVDFDPSQNDFKMYGSWTLPSTPSNCSYGFNGFTSFIAKYAYCEAPITNSLPGPTKACKGSNPSITFAYTGSNPMNYQWYKNGRKIQDQIYPTLSLSNIQYADSGIYYCELDNKCGSIFTGVVDFKVDDCSIGTEENEIENRVRVFPNPANSHLTVAYEGGSNDVAYRIIDFKGQVILKGRIDHSTIDIGNVSQGTYILELLFDSSIFREKILIQK